MHIPRAKRRMKHRVIQHYIATTIYAVRHNGKAAMAGDGQVTLGQQVIIETNGKKSASFI